jgi:acetylornithine/succinyldiaminopimelate/putrescine aminotransferase
MVGKRRRLSRMHARYFLNLSLTLSLTDWAVLQHIADLIGADTKDIVFTSGATETNNMSIKGVARFHKEKKKHIITTQTVGHLHRVRRFKF